MKSCPLIPSRWELPQMLRLRLGHGPGRQRAMDHEGHLLLVLHELPKHGERHRTGQLFWRNPEGAWLSTLPYHGEGALERHLESFSRELDSIHENLEKADDSEDFFLLMAQLSPLVRTIRNLHGALQQAREFRKEDLKIINWRDEAYALSRRSELLLADAKNALDFEIAQQAEAQSAASHQMAASAHRLNVLASFFFPLVTLFAIFGANLKSGLESYNASDAPYLFFGVLAVGVLLGFVLTFLITLPARRPLNKKEKKQSS